MIPFPPLKLSVVIPAYNEEETIAHTLAACVSFLKKMPYTFEIIVVDDGSKDKTALAVTHTQKTLGHIQLLKFERNCGKGAAIKRGVEVAQGERILFMDADHSVSIDHLHSFMDFLDSGFDIAIASIELEGASIRDVHHPVRRCAGKVAKVLIRAFAVPDNFDTQRGFKLFTQAAAKQLFQPLKVLRWGFDIEVLVRAKKKGYTIKEIPVTWHNDKKSAIGIADYIVTFFELIAISVNSRLDRYH